MITDDPNLRRRLLSRGRRLEGATLGWNVVGIFVLAYAAVAARSVALAGFGLDSLVEIGASTVVLWELADMASNRQRRAMQMIGAAFAALATYLAVQSTVVLVTGYHPHHRACDEDRCRILNAKVGYEPLTRGRQTAWDKCSGARKRIDERDNAQDPA